MNDIFTTLVSFGNLQFVYTSPVPTEKLANALQYFDLAQDEHPYFLYQDPLNTDLLLITSKNYYINNKQKISIIPWNEIISIIYNSQFQINNKIEPITLHRKYFGLSEDSPTGNKIAIKLNNLVRHLEQVNMPIKIADFSTVTEDNASEFISRYDEFVIANELSGEVWVDLLWNYLDALVIKKEYFMALEVIDDVEDYFDDGRLGVLYWHKGFIYEEMGDLYKSISNYKRSLFFDFSTTSQIETKNNITGLIHQFNSSFLSIPRKKRKFIFIDTSLNDTEDDSFIVLDKYNLPIDIRFPNNNPQLHELYIIHPHFDEIYLPYSTYESQLAIDKVQEYFYFLQCLGAKKIIYKIINGTQRNSLKISNLEVNADVKIGKGGLNKAQVYVRKDGTDSAAEEASGAHSRIQILNPTKKPYLPSDLIWYEHDYSWHRLYQQRINGDLLHHHESISSRSIKSVSGSEELNIKASFKNLFINADANLNKVIESNFNSSQTFEIDITIEFESVDNLIDHATSFDVRNNHAVEREYVEEVKIMFSDDGVIDDKERRILDRLATRFKISPEKAASLEMQAKNAGGYSEDEQEYLDEYIDLRKDGELTSKDRQNLNRFALRLGISKARALEVEQSAPTI